MLSNIEICIKHVHVFECNDVMYYKVGVYYMLSNIEVRIIYVHVHVCMH